MAQITLFDAGLEFEEKSGVEKFTDETGTRLARLFWESREAQSFSYNETGDMVLIRKRLNLKGVRRLDKSGKFKFILCRDFRYSDLDDVLSDEIPCEGIGVLESCFKNEQFIFERDRKLPPDVLFDGHRYCWRFKENGDGTISFVDRVF